LLTQALKLHEAGRNKEAHELTMQAADHLKDAVSIEGFRLSTSPNTLKGAKSI
jgi:hypothetical protein